MPRHILIKLTKIKHKERILKATREKQRFITTLANVTEYTHMHIHTHKQNQKQSNKK